MTDNGKKQKPPYVPFGTFVNFINGLNEEPLPTHIDKSLMPTLSGGIQSILLSSLRATGLINEDGSPSERLERYAAANDAEKKKILVEAIQAGFPALFASDVDLTRMTPHKFDEILRNEYDLSSSTLDKSASFFLSAAETCGLTLGSHLKNRRPASKKMSKPKRQRGEGNGENSVQPPPPPPATTSEGDHVQKPLEYQLIDLMAEPDIDDDVKQSIWALVQFLAKRKIRNQSPDE